MGLIKRKKKVEGNQKVRNAIKCVFNDIKFDSKLELYFYKLCLEKNIVVEREPKFILQPKFEYLKEKVREIAMFPDFFLPNYNTIVETKGMENDVFPVKRKMLLHHLHTTNKNHIYVVLKNQKQCKEFIDNL